MGGRLSVVVFIRKRFNAAFSPKRVHRTISAGLSDIAHAPKKLSMVVEWNVHPFLQNFIATLRILNKERIEKYA